MRHCSFSSSTQRILISDPPDKGVTRELVWPSAGKALLPVGSREGPHRRFESALVGSVSLQTEKLGSLDTALFVTLTLTINETLKWLLPLPIQA